MRNSRRFSRNAGPILAIAALTVGGSAIAAGITSQDSNAGQGVDVVEGFSIDDVEYFSDATENAPAPTSTGVAVALVDAVSFTITRDDTSDANQSDILKDDNADVFIQLRTSALNTTWIECFDDVAGLESKYADIVAGTTDDDIWVCDTSTLLITAEALTGISVVAYDQGTSDS